MLFTSERDVRTNVCCTLYAFDGSESAGRIEVMKSVKISCQCQSSFARAVQVMYSQLVGRERCIWGTEIEYFH